MPDPFRQILFLVAPVSALALQVYKQQGLTISPFLYNFTLFNEPQRRRGRRGRDRRGDANQLFGKVRFYTSDNWQLMGLTGMAIANSVPSPGDEKHCKEPPCRSTTI